MKSVTKGEAEDAGVVTRVRRMVARSPKLVAACVVVLVVAAVCVSNEIGNERSYELDAVFPTLSQHDLAQLNTLVDSRPASVKVTDADGNRPLRLVALDGWAEGAEALLLHGADPNVPNAAGQTPVHLALNAPRPTQYKTVSVLLRRGASVKIKTNDGRDASALANATGNLDRRVLSDLQTHAANR